MLLVYTGKGKGKTSASVGQAVRALGQEMAVAFGQFMKRPGQAGEQKVLAELLGERFHAGGKGFFKKEENRAEHRQAALDLLVWAEKQLPGLDMLILDESLYALGLGILHEKELRDIIDKAMERRVHLVLSGRGLPAWLRDKADLVTEMEEIKHPYAEGGKAVKGIEF
jgi:ATP:corrinoid adenosyltransferase